MTALRLRVARYLRPALKPACLLLVLAAMAMLPQMRKASPPDIFFSVSSGLQPMSCRIRPASSWS